MKTTDLAFAVTLSTMLLASLAAVGNLGLGTGPANDEMPVFRLEPVVITGTKGSARAADLKKAQFDEVTVPSAREQQIAQQRV
ncbi:MAG TPA: hypothetical protein VFL64_21960 [Rhizobacter sp.]|nr:hypothetical protein [Rhizobacter sp.]